MNEADSWGGMLSHALYWALLGDTISVQDLFCVSAEGSVPSWLIPVEEQRVPRQALSQSPIGWAAQELTLGDLR